MPSVTAGPGVLPLTQQQLSIANMLWQQLFPGIQMPTPQQTGYGPPQQQNPDPAPLTVASAFIHHQSQPE